MSQNSKLPLVSICIPTWNGEAFIESAISSLVNQTYSAIEIIILDNLSTDRTGIICKAIQRVDNRVQYILDKQHSGDPEGHIRAYKWAKGQYIMLACDDDVYHSEYISRLVAILESDSSIGFAYSSYKFIDTEGNTVEANLKKKYLLKWWNSPFGNFAFYMLNRNPIPINFAIFRRNIYAEALRHFYRPSRNYGDHDNLFIMKALSLAKVDSIDDPLFFYRLKDRSKQLKKNRGLAKVFLDFAHQIRVYRGIIAIIRESRFPGRYILYLHLNAIAAFLKYAFLQQLLSKLKALELPRG
jgi:glycosyltransferase involved in cell wall biosynthesis